MNVIVTGATGFVGTHVVDELLARGHSVVAIARNQDRAHEKSWYNRVTFIKCDLSRDYMRLFQSGLKADVLIHLAWQGLPNYKNYFHIGENLPASLAFLQAAVDSGIDHLLVSGTCLEYGMIEGALKEETETRPSTPYGFAKDSLRKALQYLQIESPFKLQWMRLFYMYGKGQNANSLFAQLEHAIDEGQTVFNMSEGQQLRDYLPIEEVARNFVLIMENPQTAGVINCCSGNPRSVMELVQERCEIKKSRIKLNPGYYPYPDYEPMKFWGVPSKLSKLKLENLDNYK